MLRAQDWFNTETSTGASNIRIAVADFKPASLRSPDCRLQADLRHDALRRPRQRWHLRHRLEEPCCRRHARRPVRDQSAAVVRSLRPPPPWSPSATSASRAARSVVNGYLFDAKNLQYPQVLAKQYNEDASEDSARQIAHRFADEIIFRLGGGSPASPNPRSTTSRSAAANKEIWEMDYDGANQHPITHLGTVSHLPAHLARQQPPRLLVAGPRRIPDSNVLARSWAAWSTFPAVGGTNITPAWAPNGNEIAYSSSRSGDPEIWISDANGALGPPHHQLPRS